MNKNGRLSMSEAGRIGWEKSKDKIAERIRRLHEEYEMNSKKCVCGVKIPYEKKHNDSCSQSCAASIRNRGVNRRVSFVAHPCKNCGKTTRNQKFCSRSCAAKSGSNKMIADIEKTGVARFGPRTVKKYLAQKRGSRCEICKGIEWMGQKIPLVLDHIDGNAENNTVKNLRLVCGNCNMQLPTFSGRNRGNGRAWRRERRHAGKNG